MRIAFDAKRYFRNQTGLGNYSRWLVDGLQERASDLELYLCHNGPEQSELPHIGPSSTLGQRLPALWRSRGIIRSLRSNNVDLFHGLSNELPFGIQRSNIASVVTIHDLIFLRYPENYQAVDRWVYQRKVQFAQKYADRIVVPSEQTARDLRRFYHTDPSRIAVIPLGLPLVPKVEEQPLIEGSYILCISSFTERKNLIRLIRAFRSSKISDTRLVIAGQKGERYARAARMSDEDSRIQLMTDLDQASIHRLYKHALFCVYPSLFEGFGIPIQEAFQHGKTVACSANSSLPEVGGDAATYFDPENVDSIRKSLEELHFSPSYRNSLEERIPERLEHFNSDRIIKLYRDLYADTLSAHSQSNKGAS